MMKLSCAWNLFVFMAIMAIAAPAAATDTLPQGLKVGDSIPQSFMATDQNGATRDFPSLGGKRGSILLFTRSLDW